MHFKQSQLNYINSQKQNKKERIKLVIVSIGDDVVTKTDDEIYALSVIKIYSFYFFSVPRKVELLKISEVVM